MAFLDRAVRFRVRLRSLVSLTLTVTRFSLRLTLRASKVRTRRVQITLFLIDNTLLFVEVLLSTFLLANEEWICRRAPLIRNN